MQRTASPLLLLPTSRSPHLARRRRRRTAAARCSGGEQRRRSSDDAAVPVLGDAETGVSLMLVYGYAECQVVPH